MWNEKRNICLFLYKNGIIELGGMIMTNEFFPSLLCFIVSAKYKGGFCLDFHD